jgi:hypothetical protein
MAKELGRAYWSMMRRQDKHLMAGMEEAFIELMDEDVSLPGKLLDSLRIAERLQFRKKREFKEWLKAIDTTLRDVRGFAPTVKLRFQDRSFTYSRDWVTKYLRPPDDYDPQENTYIYNDIREHCLRDRARPLECVFFFPGGKTHLMPAWTVPSRELWKDYKQMYLNPRNYPAEKDDRALYAQASKFIEATRLLPRAEEEGGVLLDSEVI